ncbi:MAG TPA: glycosyltransferase family 4 protein [Candidatus Saccharimonadales bacterium]
MRVLMLGWELPPYNAGGMGVECIRLCKALSKKGADIEFVIPYTADHSEIDYMKIHPAHPQDVIEVLKAGTTYDSAQYMNVTSTGEIRALDLHGQVRLYEEAVGRMIPTLEYFDVIHAHDWLTCRAAIRAKLISGRPLIVHMHSIESDRSGQPHGGNPLVREIEELGMLMADRIIAVSEVTKRGIVREYNIPPEKIEVVHNNLSAAEFTPFSEDNEYRYLARMKQQGYRVVVNVGRLTIQKGLAHLLEAFRIAVQYRPKSLLLLVGAGEQYYELVTMATELGIGDKVIFTDFQRGKRWRDSFSIGDLFVMPSPTEPFGLTALEAINFNTPILITKETGAAEVITNGLRVDYWDHDEMANKIVGVLNSDELRNELSANAFRELDRMVRGDKTADEVFSVYERHALVGAAA